VLLQGEPCDAAVNLISMRIEFYNKSIMERLCTLNTASGNPVDSDASGAKASTKHLESRLQVIQGHAFWNH